LVNTVKGIFTLTGEPALLLTENGLGHYSIIAGQYNPDLGVAVGPKIRRLWRLFTYGKSRFNVQRIPIDLQRPTNTGIFSILGMYSKVATSKRDAIAY
jgi:hypothetical protein